MKYCRRNESKRNLNENFVNTDWEIILHVRQHEEGPETEVGEGMKRSLRLVPLVEWKGYEGHVKGKVL